MNTISIESLCDEVAGAELMAHVVEFAKRTKHAGTPEEYESFQYLQSVLGRLGYSTSLILHDAYISLPGIAKVEISGQDAGPCITHSFSQPSQTGGTSAEVVYVGEGKSGDYQGKDVRGKIVLVEGMARPAEALLASKAGAIGQLQISPVDRLHEMCISPVWGNPSPRNVDQLPATTVVTISREVGEALRERIERGETVQAVIHAQVNTGWRKIPLLVADLVSPDPIDDTFVMFSGHHDTWHFGVMDNGSANATMLEVARIFARHASVLRRGLRFCFWSGHSQGRYAGSAWYADNHWDELDRRCAAHINIDSTGGKGADILTNSGVATELRAIAAEVIKAESGQQHGGRRVGRQGDQSFWGLGIPAIFGSISHHKPDANKARGNVNLGYWWHTPEDTLDKIDEANLVRDTRVFVRTLWKLAAVPLLPFDYAAVSDDLLHHLAQLGDEGQNVPLSSILPEVRTFREQIKSLNQAAQDGRITAGKFNKTLLRIGRALIPVDCTSGDRFEPDPALALSPWPVLDPIRRLTTLPPDSDDAQFATVAAIRARNRLLVAVRTANDALTQVLA